MTFKKQLAIGMTLAMLPMAALAQGMGGASSGAGGNAAGGNTGTAGTAATAPATGAGTSGTSTSGTGMNGGGTAGTGTMGNGTMGSGNMSAPTTGTTSPSTGAGMSGGSSTTAAPMPDAASATPASGTALSDQDFVTQAANANMAEIKAGKLAEKKGSGDVKSFAKEMVMDHTKAGKQLMALAKQKKLMVPKTVDADHMSMFQALKAAKGTEFNTNYASGQVTDHQAAVALFTQEANSGTDADLKAFAQTMLPTMQHHLDMAKDLAGKQS